VWQCSPVIGSLKINFIELQFDNILGLQRWRLGRKQRESYNVSFSWNSGRVETSSHKGGGRNHQEPWLAANRCSLRYRSSAQSQLEQGVCRWILIEKQVWRRLEYQSKGNFYWRWHFWWKINGAVQGSGPHIQGVSVEEY